MNYEVYSYWNLLELEGVFNAVAALTASSDFTGLLRVLALIVMITLALAVLAGRSRHEDFWRWVMMAAIVNGMLLVPKSTVTLIDRTGTEPNRVVANVPIGLAALAHGASKLGDWITRAYETVFSLPNDLQFQRRGLMFGHAVLTETQFLSPDMVSGAWMKDFQEFWRECVTPDIITGYLPIDTLRKTTDLWSAIGNTNPARYVTLSTVGTVSCHPAAYNDLGNRLNNSVVPALITSYGLKKFPNDPQAVTNAQNGIVAAYGYGPGISNTAQSIVRQAALQQAMVQAYCGVFAQSGDSNRAALCYSTAMGAYQTNQTYQVLAKIAESSMPKLKSAIEIIQYAIAPIIIAFAIVAAHLSLPVLKTYAMSLVWVQLWAPLYAVVHYIQTVKMQAYQAALGASAGTLEGSAQLVNMGVSDQAVAGMLVVAIPPIAAALVKGGEVGLQAVAGLVSAPRTAERQAADTAKGNEHIGDWNTAPTIRTGAPIHTAVGANGVNVTTFADGTTAVDASGMQHRMNLRLNAGSRMSAALQEQSEQAQTAAVGELVSGARSFGASIQRGIDFARSHLKETSNDNRWGIDNAAEIAKAAETAQNIQDKYLKEHGVNEKLHAAIKGTAAAIAQTPELLNAVSPVKLKAQLAAELGSETDAAIAARHALHLARTQGYSEAVRTVSKATQSNAFSEAEKGATGSRDSVQALSTEGLQRIEQASANYQRSLALKEATTRARENSGAWEMGLLRQFGDWMGTQYNGYAGRNFDVATVAQMSEKNPELLTPFIERFFKERVEPTLSAGVGEVKTAGDVQAFFERGKAGMPTAGDIAAQDRNWRGQVQGSAARAGVDPNAPVADTRNLKGQVDGRLSAGQAAVAQGKGRVEQGGKPIEQGVKEKTDQPPSFPGMAGTSIGNAAAAGLPSGTVWGVDKAMDAIGLKAEASHWRKDADSYQGGWAGFAIDTALMAAGGPVGKVAGKAAGKVIGNELGEKAAQNILKENATTAVGHNYPVLTGIVAGEAKQEVIDAAASIGARAGVPVGMMVGGEIADRTGAGATLGPKVEGALNQAVSAGEGAVRETFGMPPQTQQPSGHGANAGVLDGAWNQGEKAAGDLFSGPPGGSNLGSLLGGGQRPAPAQTQPAEGEAGQQKSDAPPPSGR